MENHPVAAMGVCVDVCGGVCVSRPQHRKAPPPSPSGADKGRGSFVKGLSNGGGLRGHHRQVGAGGREERKRKRGDKGDKQQSSPCGQ